MRLRKSKIRINGHSTVSQYYLNMIQIYKGFLYQPPIVAVLRAKLVFHLPMSNHERKVTRYQIRTIWRTVHLNCWVGLVTFAQYGCAFSCNLSSVHNVGCNGCVRNTATLMHCRLVNTSGIGREGLRPAWDPVLRIERNMSQP